MRSFLLRLKIYLKVFLPVTVMFLVLSNAHHYCKESVFPEQIRHDVKAFIFNLLQIPTDMKVYASVEDNVLWYSKLNLKYLVNNENKCKDRSPFVIILVDTSPDHFSEREVIRKTWGNLSSWRHVNSENHEVLILFVVGISKIHTESLQKSIGEENEHFKDIIQENFTEDFHNLTIKVVSRLKWPLLHCRGAKYIMKTDDDVFVNVANLLHHLKMVQPDWYYSGRLHSGSPRNVQKLSKYYVPEKVYRGAYYPRYCSGGGYILSMNAAEKLYAQTEMLPLLYIEDVFVGILANSAGISPKHDNMLFGEKTAPSDLCSVSKFITSHGHKGSEMVELYETVLSLRNLDPNSLCWGKLFSWVNPNDLVYF